MTRSPLQRWFGFEPLEARQHLAAISWDGGGGDLSWHNPLNWSSDVLPGPNDDVTINVAGTATITHQGGTTSVASLISVEPLEFSGGASFSVEGLWRQLGGLTVEGSTLSGGEVVLNADAHVSGSVLGPGGRVIVAAGRTLWIEGDLAVQRAVTVVGTVVWNGGTLTLSALLTTLPGADFTLVSGGLLTGTGTFANGGTLHKNGPAGSTTTIAVTFSNRSAVGAYVFPDTLFFPGPLGDPDAGVVDVYAGTLQFTGAVLEKQGGVLQGGHWWVRSSDGVLLLPDGDITSAGYIVGQRALSVVLEGAGSQFPQIAAALNVATLVLRGRAFPLTGECRIGRLVVDNAGMTHVPGLREARALEIPRGTLVVGDFHTDRCTIAAGAELRLTGRMWMAGSAGIMPVYIIESIVGEGLVRVTGTLRMSSGSVACSTLLIGPTGRLIFEPHTHWQSGGAISSRLINYGLVDVANAREWIVQREIVNRGELRIGAGASFTSPGVFWQGIEPRALHNFGTLVIHGNALVTFRAVGGGVRLLNHGAVRIDSGTLRVFGGGATAGQWSVAQGAEIAFGGLDVHLRHASIGGGGLIRIGANMRFESGGISGAGDMFIGPSGRLTLLNPQPNTPGQNNLIVRTVTTNNGRIDVEDAAEIRGALRNSGTLAIGGTLATDRFVPFASSVLRIRSTGDQQNAVLRVVHGGFFQGTLALDFLWQPPVGHVFTMYQTTILNAPGEPFDAFDQVVATGLLPGRGVEFFVVSGQQTTAAGRVRIT